MPIKTITYGEIAEGMKVWESGYLFEVTDLRSYEDQGKKVIRYTGKCVDKTCDIYNTNYNGGTYGAYAHVLAYIEISEAEAKQLTIAKEIADLSARCFENGKTIDGKLWNEENDELRKRHGITLDEWYVCRDLARKLYDK